MLKRQQALQRNDLGAPLGREMICCGSALKILFHFARAILSVKPCDFELFSKDLSFTGSE